MRIVLLCHVATEATRAGRFPRDEPLDDKALDGLVRHPPRLPGHALCLVSPAARARQTATALGLDPTIEPALRDIDYGAWAGLSLESVEARDPAAAAAWLTDPAAAPHGGETPADAVARVGAWIEGLHAPGPVLAVTHPAVVRAAVVHALRAPAAAYWHIDVGPLALATLTGRAGHWRLAGLVAR